MCKILPHFSPTTQTITSAHLTAALLVTIRPLPLLCTICGQLELTQEKPLLLCSVYSSFTLISLITTWAGGVWLHGGSGVSFYQREMVARRWMTHLTTQYCHCWTHNLLPWRYNDHYSVICVICRPISVVASAEFAIFVLQFFQSNG